MSGWLPEPDVAVAVMGICINTSGGWAQGGGGGAVGGGSVPAPKVRACEPSALCVRPASQAEPTPSLPPSRWLVTPPPPLATPPPAAGLVWMVVTGFSLGCSTRVGNSLGAGHPRTARRSAWTAAAITTCVELAAACGIVALRHSWAYVFTGEGGRCAVARAGVHEQGEARAGRQLGAAAAHGREPTKACDARRRSDHSLPTPAPPLRPSHTSVQMPPTPSPSPPPCCPSSLCRCPATA